MQGMPTDDDHKQFGKRNLPLGMCTVALYCGVKCVLHRGYVLKYVVEYKVTTSYLYYYYMHTSIFDLTHVFE
jgi:hypothetical protein